MGEAKDQKLLSKFRCKRCQIFTPSFLSEVHDTPQLYLHHDSFAALEESAKKGCTVCRILRQGLIYDAPSFTVLQKATNPVKLRRWANITDVVLDCEERTVEARLSVDIAYPEYSNQQLGDSVCPIRRFDQNSREQDLRILLPQVGKWIDFCLQKHTRCRRKTPPEGNPEIFLPTRLIDVGPTEETHFVKLYLTDQGDTRLLHSPSALRTRHSPSEYVTLSYCWGDQPHSAYTSKSNIKDRLQGIAINSMPTTFRDAILITRKIGVRYLWIDALCIIQPTNADNSDWQKESARMGHYYQNSICTIAAAGASDSSQGCFIERYGKRFLVESYELDKPTLTGSEEICIKPILPQWRRTVLESPLLTRGWVFQEIVMSPRILYWTKDAAYWECHDLAASEYHPKRLTVGEYAASPTHGIKKTLATPLNKFNRSGQLFSSQKWYDVVEHFSMLKLTCLTDKLPALSGLAKAVQEYVPNRYLAGIWHDQLPDALMWYSIYEVSPKHAISPQPSPPFAYICPSWSWPAVHTKVKFERTIWATSPTWAISIEDVKVELASDDPTGQLKGGSLRVTGRIQNLIFAQDSSNLKPSPDNPLHWICEGDVNSNAPSLHFDTVPDLKELKAGIPCLLLCKWSEQKDKPRANDPARALMLRPTGSGAAIREFRRIGYASLSGRDWFDNAEVATLEVV